MPPTAPEFPLHLAPSTAREADEEIDPELLALPAPPKRERSWTIAVLAVTIAASLAMMVSLLRDAAYAFAPSQSTELGDLRLGSGNQIDGGLDNHFVHAEAMLGAAGALRYERAFDSDSYRVAPVAGRTDVWVEIRMKDGEESSRFIPPTSFAGRLVRFSEVGPRHRGLRDEIGSVGGTGVPDGAWLLVDGEQPANARWAVALIVLFAGFAIWNALAIAKLVRKVE
ncbi:MAG: hypothetical protein ABI183_17165 [Polyangiaceae bacterium]